MNDHSPTHHFLRTSTQNDLTFQAELYATTRQDEMDSAQFPAELRPGFLALQFKAQTTHYTQAHPDAEWMIIESEGNPVGRLILDRAADHLNIMDIALLPAFRGRGIGSYLIQQVLDEAQLKNLPVRLFAFSGERAIHLYHRLGFQDVNDDLIHTELVWKPTA